jgi:hypothetical protein
MQENPVTRNLNEALGQVLTRQQVTLLNGGAAPIPILDPSAMSSGLPYIRLDNGREGFKHRRKRVAVERAGRQATLMVRCRPLPPEPDDGWLTVAWGRDRLGRRLPLCAVERNEGRIHVLLDLAGAEVLDASGGEDATELLAEVFIGEPLTLLLERAGEPTVGCDVPRQVRALLERAPREYRKDIQRELSLLERFGCRDLLPSALCRRIDKLKGALVGPRREVPEERVEWEVERLDRFFASRALASLRFAPDRIEGLINPGTLGEEWRMQPVVFGLRLGFSPLQPTLQMWSPTAPAPRGGFGHCLGEAEPVLSTYEERGDLYGIVDTVINFRETNRVRSVPVEPPPRARRLADWLAAMF